MDEERGREEGRHGMGGMEDGGGEEMLWSGSGEGRCVGWREGVMKDGGRKGKRERGEESGRRGGEGDEGEDRGSN
jgi:hypothetical protein